MKLKWDKSYLKISIYAIFTLVCSYSLFKVVDSAAYIVTNIRAIVDGIGDIFGYIFSVCSVLVMAFIIAYLLDPLVDFFQVKYDIFNKDKIQPFIKRNFKILIKNKKSDRKTTIFKRRTAGTAITYIFFFIIIGLIVFLITTRIGNKINEKSDVDIVQNIIDLINGTLIDLTDFYANAGLTLSKWGATEYLSDFVANLGAAATSLLAGFSNNIVSTITSTGSRIVDFFMALVVAFYFLRDKESIHSKANELSNTFLPAKLGRRVKNALGDIHVVFSGYIRGQLTDAAIMGILLSCGLSLVGVNFAVIIGVFSGFANIIPYFGAFVGFILSVSMALFSGDPTKAIYAGVVVLVLQQIDGVFIVPKVVGEKVELSPALVLLSLSIFGSLFGLVGMIFAVPACAIIKIFLIRFTERHKRNKLEKEREMEFNKSP